jgi:hypothetical protein
MSLNSRYSAAISAWQRLWRTGVKGDNIGRTNTTESETTRTHTNYSNNRTQSSGARRPTRRSKYHKDTSRNNLLPTMTTTTTTASQTTLSGDTQDLRDVEEFGHTMAKKPDKVLRLLFHNINRLPLNARHSKSRKLLSTLAHKQIDLAMLAEIGLYWKKIPQQDRWYERTREAFKTSKSELAYNTTEHSLSDPVQFGGTCVIAIDDCVHRVVSQGSDDTGLGRWAWLRLEGQRGHHLRVISAYRPTTNHSAGTGTVHAQQERYFTSKDRDIEPRMAFYTDLFEAVDSWKREGDQIILGIDANEDVRTGDTMNAFSVLWV